VDDGCDGKTCPSGKACRLGACTDACQGAVCPGGVACHAGVCDPPPSGRGTGEFDGGILVTGSGGLGPVIIGSGGMAGTADAGAIDVRAPSSGSGGGDGTPGVGAASHISTGCACGVANGGREVRALALGLLLVAAARRSSRPKR
jgi:hypothetical protein